MAMEGCDYAEGRHCAAGMEEITNCTAGNWLFPKAFCCPHQDDKCNPATRPELQCKYIEDYTSLGCGTGMYEEEDCSQHFYGGVYSHEFCCRDQTSCMTENPDCSYNDGWTGMCPTGTEPMEECEVEHFLNTKEFCCKIEGQCSGDDPNHPLQCKYTDDLMQWGCPTGYKENEECSVTRPWYEGSMTHE